MTQLGRRQPELLAFVTTMAEDLSQTAQETAIYAFVVICLMFESSSRKSLPLARSRQIEAAYERINGQLGRLIAAGDHFLERHAAVSAGREPFVVRYVTNVLLEPDDPEAKLPDEELGETFMCLFADGRGRSARDLSDRLASLPCCTNPGALHLLSEWLRQSRSRLVHAATCSFS